MEQKVLRWGTMVVVGALLLRLLSGIGIDFVLSPQAASWIFFFQTGRMA